VITECPPWVLAKVERLFLGECHEDAAKVKLCKIKEKEGRKEGRVDSNLGIKVESFPREFFSL
jgi:ribosomal protein S4E